MQPQILSLGDILVEVMRKALDQPLDAPADFTGPYPSGASAIFTDAAARLGGSCGYIGVVGADEFGTCVMRRLQDSGVDITHVRRAAGHTTGIAFVMYRSDGSRQFVFSLAQSAAALLTPDDVPVDTVRAAKFVHITGSALSINPSVRQACYRAVALCKAAGGRVSFDPNVRPELLGGMDPLREIVRPVLDACDVLLPSSAEALLLMNENDEGDEGETNDADAACQNLIARGIPIVALKRGALGSRIFTRDEVFDAPPIQVTEIDPTGAGDCYGGAFIVGLLHGWELRRIARFANIAGGLAVTQQGPMAGSPTLEQVLAYL